MINIDDRLIKEVGPKIGANALSVLLAIAIHVNQKTDRCFPSHSRLMMLTGIGRDGVYKALEKLKSEKLLTVEQKIDTKTGQFGRRTFLLSTRFIKIFVDVADAEPLTEIPDTATPDTATPDTVNQETEQINESEQINELEQISNRERESAPAQKIQFNQTPTFKTPTELKQHLTNFFKDYPEEWAQTVEAASMEYARRKKRFDKAESYSAVASYCEWACEEGKAEFYTYKAHNARLRRWMRDQAQYSKSEMPANVLVVGENKAYR